VLSLELPFIEPQAVSGNAKEIDSTDREHAPRTRSAASAL